MLTEQQTGREGAKPLQHELIFSAGQRGGHCEKARRELTLSSKKLKEKER